MRIRRLNLEFFGHFTDKVLDFAEPPEGASDFHIIYGPNEAGKTTIMEGYLRLLYGFQHSEPYAFKHNRPSLKVSAELGLRSGVKTFTRLPGRNNNLVDSSGTPLPETTLQAELAGLKLEDYRQLLCLDDATIEAGGDEIVKSKGDIGRLLFSAAAGVSDLSLVLDSVERQSEDLYKKGGSKSVFAGLKRELEELAVKIRDTDISAAVYRQRKQRVDDAKVAEKKVRAQRKEKLDAQATLSAIAQALPMVSQVALLEQQLEPLQHFPPNIDVDPEKLVETSNQRVVLEAEKTRLETTLTAKIQERDAITLQPELAYMVSPLADLKGLRDRVGSAATDLPRRNSQRDDVVQDMIRSLADIGLKDVKEPQQFVFDQTRLSELETAFNAVSQAEQLLQAAVDEENQAREHLNTAEKELEGLPQTFTDVHDLKRILETQDAPHVVTDVNKATEALRLVQQAAQESLVQLSVHEQSFDRVPELGLNAKEATTLARNIETTQTAVIAAEDAVAEAEETYQTLMARVNALETSGAFITDDDASMSRRERDRLWGEHLGNLTKTSADAFEAAMRLDDTKSDARFSQTKDLAEVRQLKATLAEAQSKVQAKRGALQTAKTRLASAHSDFERQCTASGLNTMLSANGFAEWVAKVDIARERAITAESERLKAAPLLEAAETLRTDLATALNAPDTKLNALVMLADKTVAAYEKHQIALGAAQKVADDAKVAHQKRTKTRTAEATKRQAAAESWSKLIGSTFGSAGQAIPFPLAFSTFRKLREDKEKIFGFQRQIDAMMADQKAFHDAVTPFIAKHPDVDSLSTLEAYDTLAERSNSAVNAADAQQKLTAAIDEAQEKLRSVSGDLSDIDAQVRLQAAIFEPTIPTGTVEELRNAVLQAMRANDMRQQISELSRDLCTLVNIPSKAEAEALLQGQSLPEVTASLNEIERDLSTLETDLTAAIENRTRAQSEFDVITGDGDVAALVARRQTIELEMERVIRQFSELRVGHLLADAAIRRYRDVHRSGMMQAAEIAFKELTNGAYQGLKTQVDGTTELLVAIQASDGAAKQAYDMSKGTRFQLYLALRAAAYDQMAQNGTVLPFFCDDIFETFDEDRTRAACNLMHRVGLKGQSIYLTHHKHVVDIAHQACGDKVHVHTI